MHEVELNFSSKEKLKIGKFIDFIKAIDPHFQEISVYDTREQFFDEEAQGENGPEVVKVKKDVEYLVMSSKGNKSELSDCSRLHVKSNLTKSQIQEIILSHKEAPLKVPVFVLALIEVLQEYDIKGMNTDKVLSLMREKLIDR